MISKNTKTYPSKQPIAFFNAVVDGKTTESMISAEAVSLVQEFADIVALRYYEHFKRFPVFAIVRFTVLRFMLDTADQHDPFAKKINKEFDAYFTGDGQQKNRFERKVDDESEKVKDLIDSIYNRALGRGADYQEYLILADAATDAAQLAVVPVVFQESFYKRM